MLGEFYADLVGRLDSASTPPSRTRPTLERGRAEAGAWAREQLQGPVARGSARYTIGRVPERPVNNARLIGARIYRTRLDLFDRWFEQHGRDVRGAWPRWAR